MTALDLTIAYDGSVTECEIAYSSNSSVLDEYACELFIRNARYQPAANSEASVSRKRRDFCIWEASQNASDVKTSKASPAMRGPNSGRWITTDDLPGGALHRGQVVVSNVALTITRKGEVATCNVTIPSERSDLDNRLCTLISTRAHYKPARDLNGTPTGGLDWITVPWQAPRD
jgi:outer membrane biosynthesis protein TonB